MKYALVQLAPVQLLFDHVKSRLETETDTLCDNDTAVVRAKVDRCIKAIIHEHHFNISHEEVISQSDLYEFDDDDFAYLGREIAKEITRLSQFVYPAIVNLTRNPPKLVSSYGDLLIEVI